MFRLSPGLWHCIFTLGLPALARNILTPTSQLKPEDVIIVIFSAVGVHFQNYTMSQSRNHQSEHMKLFQVPKPTVDSIRLFA